MQVPIVDSSKYVTLAVLTFVAQQQCPVNQLAALEQEFQSFLLDFVKQRHTFQELWSSQSQLMAKLQGEKIT